MREIAGILSDAVGTGEIIKIVYNGGSQPGRQRDIQPLSVHPPYVEALCHETGKHKTFRLDRMELASGSGSAYVAGASDGLTFTDLVSRFSAIRFGNGYSSEYDSKRIAILGAQEIHSKPLVELTDIGGGYRLAVSGRRARTFRYLDKALAAMLREVKFDDEVRDVLLDGLPRVVTRWGWWDVAKAGVAVYVVAWLAVRAYRYFTGV